MHNLYVQLLFSILDSKDSFCSFITSFSSAFWAKIWEEAINRKLLCIVLTCDLLEILGFYHVLLIDYNKHISRPCI